MKLSIPLPLQQEHEALHEDLRRATRAGGEVGEAARALAGLMHPHFVKEDQIALPPLGILARLSRGELADTIIESQRREIEEMKGLVEELRAGR